MFRHFKKKLLIIISIVLVCTVPAVVYAETHSEEKAEYLLASEGGDISGGTGGSSEQVEEPSSVNPEEPSVEPGGDPTPAPEEDPTPTPGEDPTPTPEEDPTPAPEEDPTPAPGGDPTPTPEEDPTPTPEEDPTPTPEEDPTPTPVPTKDPTPEPTITPAEEIPDEALNAFDKTVKVSEKVKNEIRSGNIYFEKINEEDITGIRLYSAKTDIPVDPGTGEEFERALNGDGKNTVISSEVLNLIKKNTVVKGEDGYLYTADKEYFVDPVTGEKYKKVSEGSSSAEDKKKNEYKPDEKELEGLTGEGSNEELINSVTIVTPPSIKEDFRFFTVSRVYAFATGDIVVKEGKRGDARDIGRMKKNDVCFILEDMNDGWLYVESGRVRGFIEKDRVMTKQTDPDRAEFKIFISTIRQRVFGSLEDIYADEIIPYSENEAFDYLRTTTGVTIAGKRISLARDDNTIIYEQPYENSRTVGVLPKEGRCYIIKNAGAGWYFVESGDVRGFINKSSLQMYNDENVKEYIQSKGEESFPLASESISPSENKSLYYSTASVIPASRNGHIRKAMIEFASQFLGHPYVWGGTSLTNGCDCSGFCQQIYAAFGYSIPRVSRDQAYAGTKIPVSEALPGDLVFYARNGQIFHVVMSTGNGGTIEAMNSENGIVNSNVADVYAVWAVRIIDDDADNVTYSSAPTAAAEGSAGMSLGKFTVSAYSPNRDQDVPYTGTDEIGEVLRQGNIAVTDPEIIPYGTHFIVNGNEYTAADCGVKVKGKNVLIFTNNALEKNDIGTYEAEVFLISQQ